MIQSYSANLNSLGNPRIFGSNTKSLGLNNTIVNLLYSRFIIERNTSGIVIYITPETTITVNASNTNTANSTVATRLLNATGLTVIFQNNRFEITGNLLTNLQTNENSDSGGTYYEDPVSYQLSNLITTLLLKDGTDTTIETQVFALSINHSNFLVEQLPCTNKLKFSYLDTNYDFQNPLDNYGLSSRGVVDYQYQTSAGWVSMGESKIEPGTNDVPIGGSYGTAILVYGFCDTLVDVPLRAIRTIREIPNCGGTSPIIYQSISPYFKNWNNDIWSLAPTLISTIPYVPSITFDGTFACCVSEDGVISVDVITLTENVSYPHNCSTPTSLKFDLQKRELDSSLTEVILTETKVGTITFIEDSVNVIGTSTLFTSELVVGSKLYSSVDVLLGTVKTITDNTHLILEAIAEVNYSGAYKSNQFYFVSPTAGTEFLYETLEKGTYVLTASLTNCCDTVTKVWNISVCNSYVVETGTCNNPTIQNISGLNFLKFTIKTYNSTDVLDSVSQKVILKDVLISPLSMYEVPKLEDGFYQLFIQQLDEDGNLIGTEEVQILFYDCNIKACEVYLRRELLGWSNCVDCIDKKENEVAYNKLKIKNNKFQIYKEILYSYWKTIEQQQSYNDWDAEAHLTEIATYTEAKNNMLKICESCGIDFNNFNSTVSSSTDCGCNK